MMILINLAWMICLVGWLVSLAIYEFTKNKWALFSIWLFTGAEFGALLGGVLS